MTATELMAEQLAMLHAYPQSLVGDANERFKELFESPRRFFAWKPVTTEDAGRVWLRRVWERGGKFYRNRPADKPVTLTSRPIRVPFRVDDTFRLENWRPVTLASAKHDESRHVAEMKARDIVPTWPRGRSTSGYAEPLLDPWQRASSEHVNEFLDSCAYHEGQARMMADWHRSGCPAPSEYTVAQLIGLIEVKQ